MFKCKKRGDRLFAYLHGEIDHCKAESVRKSIEASIADPAVRCLILDFTDVSFIDSSGIGMVIGRYKTMKEKGGSMEACGMNKEVERLYRIAGLHRIIPIVTSGGSHEQQ